MGDAAAPSMRDKNLLQLFLGLNVALAACLVVYLFLSSNRAPAITTTSFANYSAKSNRTSVPVLTADRATPATNGLVAGTNNASAASASNAAATGAVTARSVDRGTRRSGNRMQAVVRMTTTIIRAIRTLNASRLYKRL